MRVQRVQGAGVHGQHRRVEVGEGGVDRAQGAARFPRHVPRLQAGEAGLGDRPLGRGEQRFAQVALGAPAEELGRDARVLHLEDVGAHLGALDRLRGLLRGGRPVARRMPDDPAVVLFTSGSEGAPKGVALSHRNLLANAAQAAARIDFGREDKVFNALPAFHSFGLTAGLCRRAAARLRQDRFRGGALHGGGCGGGGGAGGPAPPRLRRRTGGAPPQRQTSRSTMRRRGRPKRS